MLTAQLGLATSQPGNVELGLVVPGGNKPAMARVVNPPQIPGSIWYALAKFVQYPGRIDTDRSRPPPERQAPFLSAPRGGVALPVVPTPPNNSAAVLLAQATHAAYREPYVPFFVAPRGYARWPVISPPFQNKAVLSPVVVPKARDKPFLVRMQGFDSPADQRRLARFTEIVSAMINSFLGTDQIVQTGVSDYKIQASPKPGTGKTGTFNSGVF